MATWKRITSETAYKKAVRRINELIDAERTDAVLNELGLLSYLVEDYEATAHPMPDVSPAEVILYMMDMKGLKQQDLVPILGTKGNVSKILSGKANLQLSDIHPISTMLGIPVDALIPKSISPNPGMPGSTEYAEEDRLYAHDADERYVTQEKSSKGLKRNAKPEQASRKIRNGKR